jgi:D-serine deaminase-like pyridoxal phosphate-dependent protein
MIRIPTLLLNEEICRRNISRMHEKAVRNGIMLRPHFKTHQSLEIGRWFREEGTKSITVSSLKMAEYFADDSWDDILVAFTVNILEIDTINDLASRIKLSLLAESAESINALSKNLKSETGIFIKIDTGTNRTGLLWNNISGISVLIGAIEKSPKLRFAGFLTHAGNTYASRSVEQIRSVHEQSISRMTGLKKEFSADFPGLRISVGDTPSCSTIDDFSMVDEIRPGNYVFYDLMQNVIGSCDASDIAVAMACPVVAKHIDRNELVIYGGAVHFSKDSIQDKLGRQSFGQVVQNDGEGWGKVLQGAYLKKMSQEHGIVSATDEIMSMYSPGDIIKILPVHSCLTADNMKEYLTLSGRRIDHFRFS